MVGPLFGRRFSKFNGNHAKKLGYNKDAQLFFLTEPDISVLYILRISLNTMTLKVESPGVYTSQGVPISVTGIAQVGVLKQSQVDERNREISQN